MKLVDLNKELEDAVDKYSVHKAGVNKEIGTSNPDKNNMPEKSGALVNPQKNKMVGSQTDIVKATNLAQ